MWAMATEGKSGMATKQPLGEVKSRHHPTSPHHVVVKLLLSGHPGFAKVNEMRDDRVA